jgi:RNA polymerase sigma factor (sigma-70 family)
MTRTDFNNLVQQLSRKMYGFAFRILSNREEAEDAVQEVFIRLWKMGDKLDEYSSINALATTMTKNYCIDQVRKRKRSPLEEYKNQEYNSSASPSPLDQLENRESGNIIFSIIEKMPENYGNVIRLREIEGMSFEEIAVKSGQNINNLRVMLSRARKMIKDEYNKYQYERRGVKPVAGKIL